MMESKELLERYMVESDKVRARVNIYRIPHENVPYYDIDMPTVGAATEAMMEDFIDDLAPKVPSDEEGSADPKKLAESHQRFFEDIKTYLKQKLTKIGKDERDSLAGSIVHKMYG